MSAPRELVLARLWRVCGAKPGEHTGGDEVQTQDRQHLREALLGRGAEKWDSSWREKSWYLMRQRQQRENWWCWEGGSDFWKNSLSR